MARPRTHDDALRVRLLEVASEAISRGGAAGVTVRDVARGASTSASAVYALFGSREALVAAVRDEAFRRFGAQLAAVPRTDDAAADLLRLGAAYRRSALAEPHFYRVMFDRAPGPGAAVERPTFVVLRDAVARVLDGLPGPAGLTATEIALGLWGHVHGLVSLELAGLLPGPAAEREGRYLTMITASGTALLAAGRTGDGPPRG